MSVLVRFRRIFASFYFMLRELVWASSFRVKEYGSLFVFISFCYFS